SPTRPHRTRPQLDSSFSPSESKHRMRHESPRSLAVFVVSSLGLWLVCAVLVLPALFESAYCGQRWSFFYSIISGQATHHVGYYVQDWYRFAAKLTIVGLLGGLGFWLVGLAISCSALLHWIRTTYKAAAILMLNTLLLLAGFELTTR